MQFHWAPTLGAKYMTDEAAQAAGEKNMRHRSQRTAQIVAQVLTREERKNIV